MANLYFDNPFIIDQIGLREEFVVALRKHPRSMWEISREIGTSAAIIKKFGAGHSVSNKVALKLRKYLDELIEQKQQ